MMFCSSFWISCLCWSRWCTSLCSCSRACCYCCSFSNRARFFSACFRFLLDKSLLILSDSSAAFGLLSSLFSTFGTFYGAFYSCYSTESTTWLGAATSAFYVYDFLCFSSAICLALWCTSSNILATSLWEGA